MSLIFGEWVTLNKEYRLCLGKSKALWMNLDRMNSNLDLGISGLNLWSLSILDPVKKRKRKGNSLVEIFLMAASILSSLSFFCRICLFKLRTKNDLRFFCNLQLAINNMLNVSQTARLKPVSNDSVFLISICLKDRKKVF